MAGFVERTIVAEVPEFDMTKSVAVQAQDCYEIFQKVEKTYRVSLYIGIAFLSLALISAFMNRSTPAQFKSSLREAA